MILCFGAQMNRSLAFLQKKSRKTRLNELPTKLSGFTAICSPCGNLPGRVHHGFAADINPKRPSISIVVPTHFAEYKVSATNMNSAAKKTVCIKTALRAFRSNRERSAKLPFKLTNSIE